MRTAFALIMNTDKGINLQDKKNIFTKNKDKLFELISNHKKLEKVYIRSKEILTDCIKEIAGKDKEALNYNLFKNEALDTELFIKIKKVIGKTES